MHYVIAVCDGEDVGYIEKAFNSQPGNFSLTCYGAPNALLDHLNNCRPSELPFLIVISDPLDGIECINVVRRLKNHPSFKLIPISVMSVFASDEVITSYYLAGANCCYKKPSDLSDWNHMADCLLTLFLTR